MTLECPREAPISGNRDVGLGQLRGVVRAGLAIASMVVSSLALGSLDPRVHAQEPTRPALPAATRVAIAGRIFDLELAADRPTRHRGLGGRDFIAPYAGMLFAWKKPIDLSMVMRDCSIPIDVAFLDARGRVVSLHSMLPEPARRKDETPFAYESRLRVYSSEAPAQFAAELAGGRLAALGVQVGDAFIADWRELAARAR